MYKNENEIPETLDKNPSVYRLWQQAQREREVYGEQLDRYYELLEEHGHRVREMKW